MKLLVFLVLVYIFVFETFAFYNYSNLEESFDFCDETDFCKKYKNGTCSEERLEQIGQNMTSCTNVHYNKIIDLWDHGWDHRWDNNSWCKHLENIIDCWAPYDECYGIEEMKNLNTSVLEYAVRLLEYNYPWRFYGELRDCPIYLKLIGGDNTGTIFGGIFGAIGLITLAVCFVKGANKNTVRRMHTEATRF